MKSRISFLVISAMLLLSCESADPIKYCSVSNPVEELDWLAVEIQALKEQTGFSQYAYVSQAEYMDTTVFILGENCCPSCSSTPPRVINCSGEQIGMLDKDDIDPEMIKNKFIIWKGDDFKCNI